MLGATGAPPVPEKTLDSKSRKDYTKYTKSGGDQSAKLVAPAQKLNQARMNDPRETVTHRAEGEGKNSQAKGSDQDGTSESAIAIISLRSTPKGQPAAGRESLR